MVVNGVRAVVPGLGHVFSELDSGNGFEFRVLLVGEEFCVVHTKMGVVVGMDVDVVGGLLCCVFFYLLMGLFDSGIWDPFVITSVEWFEVYIILVGLIALFLCCQIIYNKIRKKKE